MIEPRATLRLQFHAGFTLDDALPWLDYFADLGISHLYASPLFRARPAPATATTWSTRPGSIRNWAASRRCCA